MFRRIDGAGAQPAGAMVLEGRGEIPFRAGDSVAVTLLAAGIQAFCESPVDGAPRAPYCMMGVCFGCLIEIDGRRNEQACLVAARPGMVLRRQAGARSLARAGDA